MMVPPQARRFILSDFVLTRCRTLLIPLLITGTIFSSSLPDSHFDSHTSPPRSTPFRSDSAVPWCMPTGTLRGRFTPTRMPGG